MVKLPSFGVQMFNQEMILMLITSALLLAAAYYVNKYKRLSCNATTMCRELLKIRRQLYDESQEEAGEYINNAIGKSNKP